MVNATQLSSYIYCPRKLFISSVLGVKEPPKEALVKGKVWHQTHEMINNNEELIVLEIHSKEYSEIFDIYRKHFAKLLRTTIILNKTQLQHFNIVLLDLFNEYWPYFEEEAKIRALNISQFIAKQEIFGEELWKKLTPKIISEKYFKSEKLHLSGIIDMIEVYDELHVPVELKTGKFPSKGMWDTHKIQLGAYLLMLEDSGKKVNEGVLRYKGSEDKRVLVMNSLLKEEILDIVKDVQKILKSLEAPNFTSNKNKCNVCSFKDLCYNNAKIKELIDNKKSKTVL